MSARNRGGSQDPHCSVGADADIGRRARDGCPHFRASDGLDQRRRGGPPVVGVAGVGSLDGVGPRGRVGDAAGGFAGAERLRAARRDQRAVVVEGHRPPLGAGVRHRGGVGHRAAGGDRVGRGRNRRDGSDGRGVGPGRAVPVRDQRGGLAGGEGAVAVVPDRPGVAARQRAHPVELVVAQVVIRAAWVGALDLGPGRAVPVQDQRVVGPDGVVLVVPDRPGAAARNGAHPVEEVVAKRARAGAGGLRPGRAVPVQDQRAGRPRVEGGAVVPGRPGVAARRGAHPLQDVLARTGAGAGGLRPGRAVPVQDQRAERVGPVDAVAADRPGVGARHGAHSREAVVAGVRRGVGAVDL